MDDFERDVRVGFVRKVLGIVAIQLAFTLALAYKSSYDATFSAIVRNPITIILSAFMIGFSLSALMCCGLTKKVPTNYALLFLFVRLFNY